MPDLLPLLRAELTRARANAAPLDDVSWHVSDDPSLPRVAIVTADAGNVQLRLAPLRLAMVRVASSAQPEPIGELVFSLDAEPDELATALREALPSLTSPLEAAGIDLEGCLAAARDRRDPVSSVRELLEWAAVLVEVGRDGPASLVVRDGLLRSIFLDEATYARLQTAIEVACAGTGHQLAAVAKSLPGAHDLTNRLLMGGVFDRRPVARTAWLEVPLSVERALLPLAFVHGRRMGPLLLVWHALTGRLVAVEVARAEDAAAAVATLFGPQADYWPEPGMVVEMAVAHDRARIKALDREALHAEVMNGLARLEPNLARRARVAELVGIGGLVTEEIE